MIGGSGAWWGGVVPAFVAAAGLAVVWRFTGKAASAWRTAVVVGYVAGHWGLDARGIGATAALLKSYQPRESRDWFPLLIALAILPDALASIGRRGPAVGWLLRGGLCLVVPWRLLNGSAFLPAFRLPDSAFATGGFDKVAWSTGETMAWIGGMGAVLLLCWTSARFGNRQSRLVGSLLAALVALGGGAAVALSASLVYGQLLGVLAATLAGCGIASMLVTPSRGPEAAAGPVVVAFGSLLIVAHFYAELGLVPAILLLIAMGLAIGWWPQLGHLTLRWQTVCRCVATLGVLGVAMLLVGVDFAAVRAEQENHPAEYNPYEIVPERWQP